MRENFTDGYISTPISGALYWYIMEGFLLLMYCRTGPGGIASCVLMVVIRTKDFSLALVVARMGTS